MPKRLNHGVGIVLLAWCPARLALVTDSSAISNRHQQDMAALCASARQLHEHYARIARPRQKLQEEVRVDARHQRAGAFLRPETAFTNEIERSAARGNLI